MISTLWDSSTDGFTAFNSSKLMWGGYKTDDKSTLIVSYPKGSGSGRSGANTKGGVGLYVNPYNIFPKKEIILEYKLFFDPEFDFVLGGKLPGIYGGAQGAHGGNHLSNGYSVRFMWRKDGVGEIYAYVPEKQDESYEKIVTKRDIKFGDSIARGSFSFKRGEWTTLRLYVKNNDPGKFNGVLQLVCNDKLCVDFSKMNFINDSSETINGIDFETFFGGSTSEWWSTKTTYTKFKDIKLFGKI